MLKSPNPHVQSLDDMLDRPVLGFEFFYQSLESSAVCFHPLVLKVEHANA